MFLRIRTALVFTAFSALTIASSGCKKKVGASCHPSEAACENDTSALVCRDGALKREACHGPLGCKLGGESVDPSSMTTSIDCDFTLSEVGAACADDHTFSCTQDKSVGLVCDSGKMRAYEACRGKGGCNIVAGALSCDASHARQDDPCIKQGAITCGDGDASMLQCNAALQWKTIRACRGKSGCTFEAELSSCDESISQAGDPCGIEGRLSCSVDGKSELICQNGRFTFTRTCKEGCSLTGTGHSIVCL